MPKGVWEKTEGEAAELARRIPLERIPSLLALLSARLLSEGYTACESGRGASSKPDSKRLVTAGQLAIFLNLPESWLRNEERLGRIPSIRAGKYVRFNLGEVERSLAERKRSGF